MPPPRVTYNGIVLGGSSLFDWELRGGVEPVERRYTVTLGIAEQLRGLLGRAADLVIEGPRQTLTVAGVYLLEIGPASNPYERTIRLADVRWLLPRTHIERSFNVRRQTGDSYLINSDTSQLIENAVIEPEIDYAPFSLTEPVGGVPWDIDSLLVYILGETGIPYGSKAGSTAINFIPIEDLVISGNAAEALRAALRYVPDISIYADLQGRIQVYNTRTTPDIPVDQLGPKAHTSGPFFATSDKSGIRPSSVTVLFTPEVEILFRYTEGGTTSRYLPQLTNVIQIPDPELQIGNLLLSRGSYESIEAVWSAWGEFGREPIPTRSLSHQIMRRLMFQQDALDRNWGVRENARTDAVYQSRVAATKDAWRRTFQVDPYFHGQIAQYRPYRCAILNPQRNSFAPAEVYSDWIRRPSFRMVELRDIAARFSGFLQRGFDGQIAGFTPSPARVSFDDPQAGIFRILPNPDPHGATGAIVLGYPVDGVLPSTSMATANRLAGDVHALWRQLTVEPNWQLGVLMTVVPGIRDPQELARVTVTPQLAGVDVEANGPPVTVRIYPNVRTARIPYTVDTEDEHNRAIGSRSTQVDWYSRAMNQRELDALATAAARRVYEVLDDRIEGGVQVDMDPTLEPSGNASSIVHRMNGGACTSTVNFTRVTNALDLFRFLDWQTQNAILSTLNNPAPVRTPGGQVYRT